MLRYLLPLLGLLLVHSQQAANPTALWSTGSNGGQYINHRPDNPSCGSHPSFIHISLFLPEGMGNTTLIAIIFGRIPYRGFGGFNVPPGSGRWREVPGQGVPKNPMANPNDIFRDSNNEAYGDRIDISFDSFRSILTSAVVVLNNWSPWNQYVSRLVRNLQWWIWDWLNGAAGVVPINQINAAISSTPPCIFEGSVNAGGKTLRLWFVHCVHSIFNADIALGAGQGFGPGPIIPAGNNPIGIVAPGPIVGGGVLPGPGINNQLPIAVPNTQVTMEFFTVHISAAWIASNPTFPEVSVVMTVTFLKWMGLAPIANTVPPQFANAYVQFGPIQLHTPWACTDVALLISSLQFIALVPGNPAGGIIANTISNTQIEVVTVMFVPGVQVQGGNVVTITLSIAALSAFNSPWRVIRGIVFADPVTANLANQFLQIGPAGTCARAPASVNCCGSSVGNILVPWPSYTSYPAWWNSLAIVLGPAGCVLPAGKMISFLVTRVYLGRNPDVTQSVGLNPLHLVAGVVQNYPAQGIWQIQSVLSTSYETHGARVIGVMSLDPLYHFRLNAQEAANLAIPLSAWSAHIMGISGNWVVGASTPLSLRVQIDTNSAGVAPQLMTFTITLRNQLATVVNGATQFWVQLQSYPQAVRSNIGSVTNPVPLSNGQPTACASSYLAFSDAHGALFATSTDSGCQASWIAGAVIRFEIRADFLLTNGPAGPVNWHMRILPSFGQSLQFAVPAANVAVGNPIPDPRFMNPAAPVTISAAGVVPVVFFDSAALMWVLGYTIVSDCSQIPFSPAAVGDIGLAQQSTRCALVSAISLISPAATGIRQCNDGATTANAQNMVTVVKYVDSQWTGLMWPGINNAAISGWPQNVALPGTAPLFIHSWGFIFSTPMFAIVVTYPAVRSNLQALGVNPAVPTTFNLVFLVRMDRLTSACSVNVAEENPWRFCVFTSTNVVQLLHFPANTVNPLGVTLSQFNQFTGWSRSAAGVCAEVLTDGAVAGWSTVGVSPISDSGSDAAWYAFFAFFALPLLLLCCCLAWALMHFRKKPEACPCVPEYPVQEMYWVNAQPAAPVYMVEPAMTMAPYNPPTTPIYLCQ